MGSEAGRNIYPGRRIIDNSRKNIGMRYRVHPCWFKAVYDPKEMEGEDELRKIISKGKKSLQNGTVDIGEQIRYIYKTFVL
jgi:hypothetical protein